ncbi:glycoside hydrolase family 13 protein [Pedobacter sp. L105]|uniref:glycoside hydrolase family 13 protein n=1 Tax=Pedobacter sp. L105 TaxID=1641871 RepID=UPI00131D3F04|nr:glycoside hydrolase family 13 protein [Pedobacter sp. L105]
MYILSKYRLTLLLFALFFLCVASVSAMTISRVEPENWWVGMKNPQLQIMVYGPDIGKASLTVNYPGVKITEVAKTENPNYLFVYLTISSTAKAGLIPLHFKAGSQETTYNYPIKSRSYEAGAMGFNASDVLYLITPDRFANGDIKNDNMDDATVNRKNPNARHGGDLEGISRHLDYIKDLGITTVWLNPTQENNMKGGSYHGYAITDFYKMDPRFGTNQEFYSLVKNIHQKGMKMVMDMVFNHCGSNHWWMKDLPSQDWINDSNKFVQTNHSTVSVMDIHASPSEKKKFTDGWFTRGMPDLNQRNRHLATYLIQNSVWWIEFAHIDGIRQDTYSYMDFDFLARWCKEVRTEYPDFNIVGETWYNKSASSAWWQENSVLDSKNSHLKTSMDFSLTFINQASFDSKTDNGYLDNIFEDIAQDFIYPDPYNLLIFLDNHDMSRFNHEGETDLKRYKQGLAFLLTTRGIPQLFYGTEILMTGTKEEGDGALRKDFPGGWPGDQTDAFSSNGRTAIQNEAWNYTQKLLQWRKNSAAVTQGKLIHYAPNKSGVYVYGRIKDNHTVMVILNSALKEQTVQMDRFSDIIGKNTKGHDVITSSTIDLTKSVTIPSKGEYVLDLE